MNGKTLTFLTIIAMAPLPVAAREQSWDSLAMDHYILGYLQASDECNPQKSVFNVRKDQIGKRGAMALYQIVHFAYDMREWSDGEFYQRQFNLSTTPSDIGISRWNKSKYILPMNIPQMIDASESTYTTNNPEGDIRIYFASDLDPDSAAIVQKLIAYKVNRFQTPSEATEDKTDTILSPLFGKYHVKITEVENGDESCD